MRSFMYRCFTITTTLLLLTEYNLAHEDVHLENGKNVRIACVTKIAGSGRCMWKSNKNETVHSISQTKGNRRFAIIGDVNRGDCTLLIMNVNTKDNGKWQCTFFPAMIKDFNFIIKDKSEEQLTMMFKYKVVNDNDKLIIDMKKDAKYHLSCIFDSKSHRPIFTWYVDDVGPEKTTLKVETDEDTGDTRYISTLISTVRDLVQGDENNQRRVRCTVGFEGLKNALTTLVFVGTEHPIDNVELIYRGPEQVSEITNGHLYCKAKGNPPPKSSDHVILYKELGKLKWEITAQHPNMTITKGGHYRCIAQNRPMVETNEWKSSKDLLIGGEVDMDFILLYLNSPGKIPCTSEFVSDTCMWVKDGEVVAGYQIPTLQEKYTVIGKANKGDCTLNIAEVMSTDEGVWRCHFFPSGRRIIKDFTVLVM